MPRQKKQHLKRRKDGRYACRYKDQWFYGETEEEALQAREDYKDAEKRGQLQLETGPTVAEYAQKWIRIAKPNVRESTFQESLGLLEKLLDHCGERYIKDILPSDIKAVYSTAFKGLSDSYIRRAKQLYMGLFDAAFADGYCRRNPAREKSAQPHRGTIGSHRAITAQERTWIEKLCTDHRAHVAVMAMLYAGLRPQEAKALDIDRDVDLEAGIITVRESVHRGESNQYVRTDKLKTAFSRRQIPILPPLRAALADHKGMLVQSAAGEAVTPSAWSRLWASYVSCMETAINGCQARWWGRKLEHKGKEMPPFVRFTVVPYDLRHSFCTMCRDNGVEINTCIHWMGHKDAQMILRIYDEYTHDRGKSEAEKLEKALIRSQNGSQKKKYTIKRSKIKHSKP